MRPWSLFALACSLLVLAQASGPPADAAPRRASPAVRLYLLAGTLRTQSTENFGITPEEAGTTDMSVPCYVIRHGRDWVMFDAGIGDDHAGRADRVRDTTLEVTKRLEPQLAAIGIRPADVRFVAVSHFHYDHVGNIAALPAATLLVQRAEAEKMLSAPYPFSPPSAVARLRREPVRLLNGDLDLFGDGTVVLLSTPGHSPGHQAMLVRLRRTGPVILTGDLYHYAAERRLKRIPIHEKAEVTGPTRERIEALARRIRAQVWIGHDLDRFKTQRLAPAFYD